jgi:hypothetical protein
MNLIYIQKYIQKGMYACMHACSSYGVMAGLAEITATRQPQLYRLYTVDQLLSASFPLNFVLYSARTFHLSFKFNSVTMTSKTGQINY